MHKVSKVLKAILVLQVLMVYKDWLAPKVIPEQLVLKEIPEQLALQVLLVHKEKPDL